MPRYMVLWKANPAAWPTDAKACSVSWKARIGGGDQLLAGGGLKELGWFTDQEGLWHL